MQHNELTSENDDNGSKSLTFPVAGADAADRGQAIVFKKMDLWFPAGWGEV
ncbi:MAG: hypothetical protein V2I97_02685 [Desulfococcaceae bacterium]|jgi:hypothetical protein|nr:hypothetical protein [Desulfococcaceae bacterium]